MAAAKDAGALTVALTCAGPTVSRMGEAAEIAIELATGPEVLTGSTRMKAGTATKLVLNMISTGVMVRQGAVFGNLMVNVQATNAKLVDRAQRIIAAATACSSDEAAGLLEAAGSVKVAIAMKFWGWTGWRRKQGCWGEREFAWGFGAGVGGPGSVLRTHSSR